MAYCQDSMNKSHITAIIKEAANSDNPVIQEQLNNLIISTKLVHSEGCTKRIKKIDDDIQRRKDAKRARQKNTEHYISQKIEKALIDDLVECWGDYNLK